MTQCTPVELLASGSTCASFGLWTSGAIPGAPVGADGHCHGDSPHIPLRNSQRPISSQYQSQTPTRTGMRAWAWDLALFGSWIWNLGFDPSASFSSKTACLDVAASSSRRDAVPLARRGGLRAGVSRDQDFHHRLLPAATALPIAPGRSAARGVRSVPRSPPSPSRCLPFSRPWTRPPRRRRRPSCSESIQHVVDRIRDLDAAAAA